MKQGDVNKIRRVGVSHALSYITKRPDHHERYESLNRIASESLPTRRWSCIIPEILCLQSQYITVNTVSIALLHPGPFVTHRSAIGIGKGMPFGQ